MKRARRNFLLAAVFVACLVGGLYTTARQRTAAALERGDLTTAAAIQNRLAWLRLDDAGQRYALARALIADGRLDEAVAQYQRALARAPRGEQWAALGRLQLRRGDLDAAVDAWQRGFELNHERAYLSRASKFLWKAGQTERAFELFEQGFRYEPPAIRNHVWLAARAESMGLPKQQIHHLRTALGFEPGQPGLRRALAWLLATSQDPQLRDGPEAVRLAEQLASETGRRDAAVLDVLAAALACEGRFDAAVLVAAEARDRASRLGQSALVDAIGARLALYRTGRPYLETAAPAAHG
ncbi:MAG TPA: tetratricopeptide repeat protein [Myxococcota bacterium]|jgi:tetratricopeptide (TPR) repeat protein